MTDNKAAWSTQVLLVCAGALVSLACDGARKAHEHDPGLLNERVARFLPDDVAPEALFPSFALVEPHYPTEAVPEGWGPAPTFTS